MQAEVLHFRAGKMGVSAVPGSGKTQVLSTLAADLIREEYIQEDQEILIVTLANSAVENFTSRIAGAIKGYGLLPGMGYRIRTLHGLAHDIVRERPDLLGLSDRFEIVDEREAAEILNRSASTWMKAHPGFIEEFTSPEYANPVKTLSDRWMEVLVEAGGAFIRLAKDLQATPTDIRSSLDALQGDQPLLEMGLAIYTDYQRALNYRGAVDFDDLIRLALRALKLDPDFLTRLRYRWPYILEDEAQDSSRLQEEILRLLAGTDGNWVRVGDPNQAIYETFTTADPRFLLNFLAEPGVINKKLPNSGRSTLSIINLANHLIEWTMFDHPNLELRNALTEPKIEPVPTGDEQPNPPDGPKSVYLSSIKYEPDLELDKMADNIASWLKTHKEETLAVLVPSNARGAKMVEALRKHNIDPVELLRASQSTRQAASLLTAVLRWLADPSSAGKISMLFRELHRRDLSLSDRKDLINSTAEALRKCSRVEDFIAPLPGSDWLEALAYQGIHAEQLEWMATFREDLRRWQEATLLPIDQLILTISSDLFNNPADLALSHKLALLLERTAQTHPDWHLDEFMQEMDQVAQNKRKFLGFSDTDSGFDPNEYKGRAVVATVHKAKGLEWDRVYVLSVNNYDFPSANDFDYYKSDRKFIRGRINLAGESLARLEALLKGDISGLYIEEGIPTAQARVSYAAERLRLLYVGITRAKRELVLSYNSGRNKDLVPAEPYKELYSFWRSKQREPQA
jgi:DNA helicase II / ATP-dependent DNA helicase PcrA